MTNRYCCRLIIQGAALLLVVVLNSCQRASYSFQPVAGIASALAEAVAPVVVSATVPADAPLPGSPTGTANRIVGLKNRHNIRQKPVAHSTNNLTTPRSAQGVALVVRSSANRYIFIVGPNKKIPGPSAEQPRSKGVAVVLAVLLGIFGAHMFYLGRSRRALSYLAVTLACIGLLLIAVPVANSAAFGSGIGAALVGIFILLMGAIGIALTYLRALFDAVQILAGTFPY